MPIWFIRAAHLLAVAACCFAPVYLPAFFDGREPAETIGVVTVVFGPIVLLVSYVVFRNWFVGIRVLYEPDDSFRYLVSTPYVLAFEHEFEEEIFNAPAKTVNNQTVASLPGRFSISDEQLRMLHPELYGIRGCLGKLRSWVFYDWPATTYLKEHLIYGDCRAAIVIETQPLLVAAYTDELDCVAMLRFSNELMTQYQLTKGSRLITVNCYNGSPEFSKDLAPGPKQLGNWNVFHPIIADFLTANTARLVQQKSRISEDEWQRAFQLGLQYLQLFPGIARDGRPLQSHKSGKQIEP